MKVLKNNLVKSDLLRSIFNDNNSLSIGVSAIRKDGTKLEFDLGELMVGSVEVVNDEEVFIFDIIKTQSNDTGYYFFCESDTQIHQDNETSTLKADVFEKDGTYVQIGLNSEDIDENFDDILFKLVVINTDNDNEVLLEVDFEEIDFI